MAVRKPEPTDSTVDGRISVDAPASSASTPATEQPARERGRLAGAYDLETMTRGWNLRLLRTGAALLAGFEIIYFILDRYIPPAQTLKTLGLHAGAVSVAVLVLALTASKWFERNWQPVCFANLLAIYALTLALRLHTGEAQPLSITLMLTVIGAGAILPWSARWQAALTAASLCAMTVSTLTPALDHSEAAYRWVGVLVAAALGHFILTMRERYRAELVGWMDSLRVSHQELADALTRSAAVMAEREVAERRLREGEEMLRKMFDAAPDSIAISRMSDGATLEVNREFLKTGYTRDEVLGVSTVTLGRWSRPPLRELVRTLRMNGTVHNFETELRNKDGRVVPSLVSATMVELGGEQCVISMARDITEFKKIQHELTDAREALSVELRELEASRRQLLSSEDKLRKVLEATGDTITLSRLKDGHYLDVNQAFCDVTGYTREETLGRSALEMGLWAHPEQLWNLLRRLNTEGRVRNLECTFRMKDGRLVEHLTSVSLIRLDGETCVVGATRDVSEIKQTERELIAVREALSAQVNALSTTQGRLRAEIADREAAQHRLQESEQTLRRIFEASLDSITIKRLSDGRYVDVNKAFELTGYTREEALGKTAEELGLWADRAHEAAVFERIKAEGQIRNVEADFRTRGGRTFSALVSSAVVELDGIPCVVSIARDISQLKQTERELIALRESALAASEAKSHFLSVMSHEIRTPMNAILGMADLLWETSLNAEQRRYLDTMRNNSTSLLNLVNGILDLSKVESGRLSLERVDFDLVELAEGVMETLGVRAHEKGLELALRIPSTFPTALTGDPLRLRQILINLLGNAIKFTERGEVTLTIDAVATVPAGQALGGKPKVEDAAASADADSPIRRQLLRFVVRDTGIGIPANQLQAIFSNFTQADSTISRKYGGSGLGLAIVKRLVELMNGRVTVESRPREGSSFSFSVAIELQPNAATGKSPASAGMARLSGKRVLVVDDSPASRTILAELLALAGAEAVVAADGTGALGELARARAAGRPYDAVVADNRMPAPDGPEIGRQILRAAHTPREALVLMLTANDLHWQLGRLRECGLEESQHCRYLLKPVRRMDLWATVAAACGAADERANHEGVDAAAATGHAARHDAFIQRAASHRIAILVNKPLKILLVEDSPDNRLLVEAYLKDTPYQLDHAENGEVAVHKFMTGHYDAILMDIQMPVMDGYEATAEIRRLEQSDHRRPTPIIALTASAHEEAVRRSLKMGCDAHVTKPVKRSTLLESIRDAVEPAAPQSAPSPAEAAGKGAGSAAAAGSEQPIVVQIDQDLSDLIPGFLSRKREDARAVLAAAEHNDLEAIVRLGHKMKGEGGSYGLDAITDIGRELEQAGKAGDFDAARRLGRDLKNFLDRLEIVYRPMED
ncbi:MAG TPA: PAS domain S-box protein [Candidatus Binataceae bacterium]|nr:PAS domain S-box protein [Candidatus Binataceae bacterium]